MNLSWLFLISVWLLSCEARLPAKSAPAEGARYPNDYDDYGLDFDDPDELTGISCALIAGDCTACAKSSGCGYCASAGVCMDERGPCQDKRPVTWHWNCPDHVQWWVVLLVITCVLVVLGSILGCALRFLCCCCFGAAKEVCCGDLDSRQSPSPRGRPVDSAEDDSEEMSMDLRPPRRPTPRRNYY